MEPNDVKTVLVTGGSKGIGLEFARQYLEKGCRVFAASRSAESSPELGQLKAQYGNQLAVCQLDVGDEESRDNLYKELSAQTGKLDLLVNNAGIIAGDEEAPLRFGKLKQADLSRAFLINSIAPLMMAEKFVPLLKVGDRPAIVNITSNNGSISLRNVKGKYGYCASKAALNMITKALSFELVDYGIIVVALHPGWVKTPMTRHEDAPLEPHESIGGMIQVIESLDVNDTGKFLDWKGREIPW